MCISSSYYYYRMFSVSQWHAHIRVLVFQTLHIVQRDTRLCPYLINYAMLYPLLLPQPRSLPFKPLRYSSITFSSISAAVVAISLDPDRSIPACSHRLIPNRSTFFLSVATQRSRSDCVAMYCATVFCLRRMYVSIISNPAKVYFHFLSYRRRRSCPVSRRATWYWKPPRNCPMREVTTHISASKSSTD